MTRDELIKAIYDSDEIWSCPDHPCDLPEEEGNTGKSCMKCAEKQLAEYEAKVTAEALKPIAKIIDDYACGRIFLPLSALNQITYNIFEQLKGEE